MRSEAQGWWDLAQADLDAARGNLAEGRFYIAAFLCQQTVEKGLKAVWIAVRRELPPKTLSLPELAGELAALERFESELLRLNPLYVSTRYPDAANGPPSRAYNRELTESFLCDAEKVIAWCQDELSQT